MIRLQSGFDLKEAFIPPRYTSFHSNRYCDAATKLSSAKSMKKARLQAALAALLYIEGSMFAILQ